MREERCRGLSGNSDNGSIKAASQMGIVTKKGDKGRTFLLCGSCVSKDDPRIEACGAVDELCSFIGLARSMIKDRKAKELLLSVQEELFAVGYEFTAGVKAGRIPGKRIGDRHIRRLESMIKSLECRPASK